MSATLTFVPTRLAGLHALVRRPRHDHRGYLERMYCRRELDGLLGAGRRIEQVNRTLTRLAGTVRGMHFQLPPHGEVKVVSCLRGKVFDVAVDVRPDSPTFLEWHAEVLSAANARSLVIPEGFAHGFQTLLPESELLYFHSAPWCAAAESALNPLDPRLGIAWPLPVTCLSQRDRTHPLLDAPGPRPSLYKVAA
jgi:dTDP-4-dehydrorhamnose 3,5-epimerase